MFELLVDHVWQSTLFVIAAALLTLAFRRHGAHVRYWIWFAASMKFLVPFALIAALGSQFAWRTAPAPVEDDWRSTFEQLVQPMTASRATSLPVNRMQDANLESAGGNLANLQATDSSATSTAQSSARSLTSAIGSQMPQLALWIWAIGALIVASVWLRRWLALRAIVSQAQSVIIDVPEAAGLQIRTTSQPIEPGVFGIASPVLLLPGDILKKLNRDELASVLLHERFHIKRRDNLTALVHMLVEVLFWFNPIVWWIGAKLISERERACDESVLASSTCAHAYARALFQVCTHYFEAPLPCAAAVGGGPLTARIRRIFMRSNHESLTSSTKAVLGLMLISAFATPLMYGLLISPDVRAQAPPSNTAHRLLRPSIAEQIANAREEYLRSIQINGVDSPLVRQARDSYRRAVRDAGTIRTAFVDYDGSPEFASLRLADVPGVMLPFLELDASTLDAYTGHFRFENFTSNEFFPILAVVLEDQSLSMEWNDHRFPLLAVEHDKFLGFQELTGDSANESTEGEELSDINVSFDSSDTPVRLAHMSVKGPKDLPPSSLVRIDPDIAKARLTELRSRYENQTPAPASAKLLQDVVMALDDERLPQDQSPVTAHARALNERIELSAPGLLQRRGDYGSIVHRETYRSGNDLFEVRFENLAFAIEMGADSNGQPMPLTLKVTCRPRSPMGRRALGDCRGTTPNSAIDED